ncbi:MAG: YebB family permuted papain-like enzyme [Burkholderiaceae bacterium]
MSGTDGDVPRPIRVLAGQTEIGDLVFIRVRAAVFMQVAEATGSWTNHVGVVIDAESALIAESKFPLSGTTTLTRFVRRSAGGRVAVARLRRGLNPMQQRRVVEAANRRSGSVYDTGFNLDSRRQFCSRYAREVLAEATGKHLGEIQTFTDLLQHHRDAALWFWQLWYFGRIPWHRETVTPASLLQSPEVEIVFDGHASLDGRDLIDRP